MHQKIQKVFLASTLKDLGDYRKAAVDAILQVGLLPISIERFGPTNIPAHEVVKKSIEESDIILFIIGHRYGTLVGERQKSWTELEYELAKKAGKPIIAFLAQEDIPWSPSKIDMYRDHIMAFRKEIQNQISISKFSTPSELASEIVKSLSLLISRMVFPLKDIEEKKKYNKFNMIRLLLSSPGDVTHERDQVSKAVFRYNQEMVEENGFFIKLVRWEDMAPQIGPGAQNVINKQIGKYHLFVGIMWNRFGTPTDIASSGTKEEFDIAIDAWEKSKRPWITFYFCERPINFTTNDQLEQKRKVLEFRSQLNDMGVVRSYIENEEFENMVYRDLIRITTLPEFSKLL